MSCKVFLLLILLETVALPAWANTGPTPLQIYVYNQADVPQKFLIPAEQRTGTILRLAGVRTQWLDCRAGTGSQSCTGLLPPDTLVLRIVHDSPTLNGDAFGAAFLALDGSGTYANVFYDRLRGFERHWKISPVTLLGHVMAHEIGHLLLGLDSHSNWGIMQAAWGEDQLTRAERGELFFSANESRILRQRRATMSEAANEAAGLR